MSTTKAIREARDALAVIDNRIKEIDANAAAVLEANKPIERRIAAFRRRMVKHPTIKAEPQGEYHLSPIGLAAYHLAWGRVGKEAKSAKAVVAAILDGERISYGSGGVNLSVKGGAQRTRYISPDVLRQINALDKRASDLERRAREARDAWKGAKKAAYDTSDARVTPEELARVVAEQAILARQRKEAEHQEVWEKRRLLEVSRPVAEQHLAHALTRSKDPCPCPRCTTDRNNARAKAEWDARNKAEAKARAKEEAAERRRLARAPKRTFECPNGCGEHTEPVHSERIRGQRVRWVECQDCESTWDLTTITSEPAGPAPGQATLPAA